MKKSLVVLVSGPSGVGKGTLIKRLKERHKDWVFPVSCTTRPPRNYEKNGENYFFIQTEEFQKKIENKEFFEYSKHKNGYCYGTIKSEFESAFLEGNVIVREVDFSGLANAQKCIPTENIVSFFIKPAEGVQQLVRQLEGYEAFSKQELDERLEEMGQEFSHAHLYSEMLICEPNKKEKLVKSFEDKLEKYL